MPPTDDQFIHRPISITVESVGEMDTVRLLPAAETQVTVNAKMDLDTARELALHLLGKILARQPVDLITFSLKGTLK